MTGNSEKEIHDVIIINEYNKIIKEIEGSQVLGQPIDLTNPKEVAIAFYYYGKFRYSKWINDVGDILR